MNTSPILHVDVSPTLTTHTILLKFFHQAIVEGAGGVFICIRKGLNVTEMPELTTNAEFIWAKVTLPNKNPIYLCSYYRPTNTSVDSILQLRDSLNKLTNNSSKFLNIVMMGDFNLPSISWSDIGAQIVSPPTYGSEVNSTFVSFHIFLNLPIYPR